MRRLPAACLAVLLLAAVAVAPSRAGAAEPFAGGCPAKALEEGSTAGLNHNPRARQAIVPAGATSLLICRYYGFGASRQTPKTQARAGDLQDRATVQGRDLLESLTLEFKELEAAPKGPIHCPEDDGAELYAIFSYPHGKPVILDVRLSGCRFVSGAAPRARWLNPSLQRRLVRLAEGKRAKNRPKHDEVKEKGAVQHPPPHLTFARARHDSKGEVEESCGHGFCTTWSIGKCRRNSAKLIHCAYSAELGTGDVCRGAIEVRAIDELVMVSPGVQDKKKEEETEGRGAAQAGEPGGRSSRATGQPGSRT